MSLNKEKHAHIVDQELSWHNIGIGITVVSATLPSRWMPKLLKRTRKL